MCLLFFSIALIPISFIKSTNYKSYIYCHICTYYVTLNYIKHNSIIKGTTPILSLDSFATTFGFSTGTSTLIVLNADRVDFDTRRSYELVVIATDFTDSTLTSNATVIINLIDYNDLSPVVHNDG